MGNLATRPHAGHTKVIGADGGIDNFSRPVTAGKLMHDNPGMFVCDSSHLVVGCRIPGLAKDEELKRRRLYFVLPMDLLYSVLTEEEMEALSCRASKAMKREKIRRVFTSLLMGGFCLVDAEAEKTVERSEINDGGVVLAWQRSWRPGLDTIDEAW